MEVLAKLNLTPNSSPHTLQHFNEMIYMVNYSCSLANFLETGKVETDPPPFPGLFLFMSKKSTEYPNKKYMQCMKITISHGVSSNFRMISSDYV